MSTGQNGDQQLFDRFVLTNDDVADLLPNLLEFMTQNLGLLQFIVAGRGQCRCHGEEAHCGSKEKRKREQRDRAFPLYSNQLYSNFADSGAWAIDSRQAD